jgi:AcrR family transcriptional regulator
VESAATARRVGAAESKTRERLVLAAEELMFEEGYAAVTSRRVGAKADVKPQLVHYYFRTMDDLFIEILRRNSEANLARLQETVTADGTLRTLWSQHIDPRGAAVAIEFVALANHRKAIRTELARVSEEFRAAQLDAVTAALAAGGVPAAELPPMVALLIMTGLGRMLAIEQILGVTSGHDDTRAFVEKGLDDMDQQRRG